MSLKEVSRADWRAPWRWLVSRLLATTHLKKMLKQGFARFPGLDYWLRHRILPFLFSGSDAENSVLAPPDRVEEIRVQSLCIKFHTAALADTRGIGRVSTAFLDRFKAMEAGLPAPQNALSKIGFRSGGNRNGVHFFPTIHWCPATLPDRSCVMVHDVIPLLYPEQFGSTATHWERDLKPIAQQADKIITISHSSARDIARLLEIPDDKIEVVYNGIFPLETASDAVEPGPSHLPGFDGKEPYFVFLGASNYHKNLEILLKAMQLFDRPQVKLYLIGANEDLVLLIKRYQLEGRVVCLGRLSDADVAYVLKGAVALLFPSLYEGFGLPPFEAALLGTPSICSERPAMTELLEGACQFCDAESPLSWVDAFHRYLDDPMLRREMAEKAELIARDLSWEVSAQKVVVALSGLASQRTH